jgi:hypothetical protein
MGSQRTRGANTIMARRNVVDLEARDMNLHGADETTIEIEIAIQSTEAQETDPQDIEIAEEIPNRQGKALQHKSVGRARVRCLLKKHHFSPTKTLRVHLSRPARRQRSKSQTLLQLAS